MLIGKLFPFNSKQVWQSKGNVSIECQLVVFSKPSDSLKQVFLYFTHCILVTAFLEYGSEFFVIHFQSLGREHVAYTFLRTLLKPSPNWTECRSKP